MSYHAIMYSTLLRYTVYIPTYIPVVYALYHVVYVYREYSRVILFMHSVCYLVIDHVYRTERV